MCPWLKTPLKHGIKISKADRSANLCRQTPEFDPRRDSQKLIPLTAPPERAEKSSVFSE
jgi:hypothetical protein